MLPMKIRNGTLISAKMPSIPAAVVSSMPFQTMIAMK